ncbi:MAG: oxidoreductase [Flavobacteriales bacterium]|jgi:NAD(P)-dependent dehydrogenase (short-subunit alcohol dehydrogenase family)|tara:strand:+ start:91 stop:1005 length:915 start_codon:yes stop_codon:yes gene_type:complete
MSFNINQVESKKGKVAIVTGANSGLGKEITIGLAKLDIKVIMACRNIKKAESTKLEILKKIAIADIEIIELDLNSLISVRNFAKTFCEQYKQLNLLIENAGIMIPPFTKTADGFESQLGVNYLSHFLLTNLLMPTLNKTEGARIATTSSIAHESGRIDFDNLNSEKSYAKMDAYRQSKLACLIFSYELQRRLNRVGSNVIAISVHPGVSKTNLFYNLPKVLQVIATPFIPFFTHSPKKAALPMLYAALGNDVKGGDYFGPLGFKGMTGKPGKVNPGAHALDEDLAKRLWEVSEKLTGEKFNLSN